jgi:hypothetical protein
MPCALVGVKHWSRDSLGAFIIEERFRQQQQMLKNVSEKREGGLKQFSK